MDEEVTVNEVENIVETEQAEPEVVETVEEIIVEDKPIDKTKEYSRNLNEARAEAKRLADEKESLLKQIEMAKKGYALFGRSDDIIAETEAMQAEVAGLTPEEFKAQQEANQRQLDEMVKTHPEFVKMQQASDAVVLGNMLKELQGTYPEDNITDIFSVGDVFIKAVKGGLDIHSAYAAQQAHNKRLNPTPPVKLPKVKGETPESDYLSMEQIDGLKKEDYLKDPKLMDKVLKSLSRK